MMEKDLVFSSDSSLDKFLDQVTTNVLRYAIERVVEVSDTINIDERVLLEQLNNDLSEDSVLQDTSGVETDFEDIKNDSDDIDSDTIHAKCSKLIEDTLAEAFAEVKSVLEEERLEIAEEAQAHERKLRLLQCIKDSERIQNLFQDISVNIIQDALGKVRSEARQNNDFEGRGSEEEYQIEENVYENRNNENDILPNINQKEGNATGNVCSNQTLSVVSTVEVLHEMATENDITFSQNDTDFGDATTESFHSLPNESSRFQSETTNANLSNSAAFTTANSVMFETAEQERSGIDSSPGTFVSFNDEGSLLPEATTTTDFNLPDYTPNPMENDVDKTLTECHGPRQSTPLGKDSSFQEMTFSAESSNISVFDNSQVVTCESASTNNAEPELEVFAGDDSSSSSSSTPRTLSRQSSAFGNVTLEFDHEWESGINSYETNSKTTPTKEVKHTVILHELSFDERADLKAPDLLGPVFLAVQDDDEDIKRKQKLSQSIDDLCEMISDDEEETQLPLRRRAMSLECKKPPLSKTQHIKVPTKDELIKAFQELRDEIMEEKDIDEEVDDEKQTELEENENELNEEVEEINEYEDQLYENEEVDEDEQEEWNEQEEKESVKGVDENETKEPEEVQNYMKNEEEMQDKEGLGGLKEDVEDVEGLSVTEPNSGDRNAADDLMAIRPAGDDPLRWQTVVFNGQNKLIDLKILEPYLKVLTHGGYHHKDGKKAVIVILTACNLPDKKLKNYTLIMEQLFFFILSTMDVLITSDEYIFVYFHGGADKNQSPSLSWLKKYYQHINRRLRKSVTNIYIVHPNLWLKSVYRLSRPFLSSNFAQKLKFVNSLKELSNHVKTDFIYIPDEVIRVDPEYKKIHRS